MRTIASATKRDTAATAIRGCVPAHTPLAARAHGGARRERRALFGEDWNSAAPARSTASAARRGA